MTWICHVRVREGEGIKSEVTQDKSNCVRRTQIANGAGAIARLTAVIRVSRRYRQILGQYLDLARLTNWHHFGAHQPACIVTTGHHEAPRRAFDE